MNVLFRNDDRGEYPPSWYTASADIPVRPRPSLSGNHRADVAVIGAGFTGLCAALTLAERGFKVAVLEAHRAGFGASGRNGGQVGSGFNKDQQWLSRKLGPTKARALWDLSQQAKAQVRDYSARYAPEANYLPGVAHGSYSDKETRELHSDAEFLSREYGYDDIDCFDAIEFRDLVKTQHYQGGINDRGAGHIHPLRYALGLAHAAEAEGATIFENSAVQTIKKTDPLLLSTESGKVSAKFAILAGNGYLPDLNPKLAARVMPINSFIAATEPLGEKWRDVLGADIAVADSKFVVNYYRMSEDRRFLFGGRESYGLGFPSDITTKLRQRMVSLFPQLSETKIDYVWGGTLGITMTRLPAVMRLAPNILTASGFSGHGVALSGFAGRVMGEAIAGQAERFDILSELPIRRFPGGAALRSPILTLAMTWYALRDQLGI